MKTVKIHNLGTQQFPYYEILVDDIEYCTTNSKENAENLSILLKEELRDELIAFCCACNIELQRDEDYIDLVDKYLNTNYNGDRDRLHK